MADSQSTFVQGAVGGLVRIHAFRAWRCLFAHHVAEHGREAAGEPATVVLRFCETASRTAHRAEFFRLIGHSGLSLIHI